MKALKLFILSILLLPAMKALAQHPHYVVLSFDTRGLAPRGGFATNFAGEVVLGKHLSVGVSAGIMYAFRTQSQDYTGVGGYPQTAWYTGNMKALNVNPQVRFYMTGEDGAPDGLYLSAGLMAIVGQEKNEITYYDAPDLIMKNYAKKGTLAGPEVGIGYQMGKEVSIITIGVYANCGYLGTSQSYTETEFGRFDFEGTFKSGVRFDGGFTLGCLLNRG